MTTLLTGLDGFVGTHLARWLKDKEIKAVPLDLQGKFVDLREPDQVRAAIAAIRPDRVYHLAAQSSVAKSWQEPEFTMAVNVKGTQHLLEALLEFAPQARVLFVSSGAVYGNRERRREYLRQLPPSAELPRGVTRAALADEDRPFHEDDPLFPGNPYAQSKAHAETIIRTKGKELDVRIVRPLGHTGPGQGLGFVVPDLASQVAAIATREFPPLLRVGRLKVAREFADVRDVVRAYHLIMEKGQPREIYNLATNEPHLIEEVATTLLELAGVRARLIQETQRLRPHSDDSSPQLDTAKIRQLGFAFKIPFQQTLADVLQEWTARIKNGQAARPQGPDNDNLSGRAH